jgi:hypothetical protein
VKPSYLVDTSSQPLQWRAFARFVATLVLLVPVLAACGFGGDDGDDRTGQIVWYQGEPPGTVPDESVVNNESLTEEAADAETPVSQPEPTGEPAPPEATETSEAEPDAGSATGQILTDAEIAQFQPNELGNVPVLMYHLSLIHI